MQQDHADGRGLAQHPSPESLSWSPWGSRESVRPELAHPGAVCWHPPGTPVRRAPVEQQPPELVAPVPRTSGEKRVEAGFSTGSFLVLATRCQAAAPVSSLHCYLPPGALLSPRCTVRPLSPDSLFPHVFQFLHTAERYPRTLA